MVIVTQLMSHLSTNLEIITLMTSSLVQVKIFVKGSSIKYVGLDFVTLVPPPPSIWTYDFSLPPLAPTPLRPLYLHLSTRVRILFFKADMTYFVNDNQTTTHSVTK